MFGKTRVIYSYFGPGATYSQTYFVGVSKVKLIGKRATKAVYILLACIGGATAAELIIRSETNSKLKVIESTMRGVFARQDISGDPYKAAQLVNLLEKVTGIGCSVLSLTGEHETVFLDNRHRELCKSGSYGVFNSGASEIKIQAANGAEWKLSFVYLRRPTEIFINWLVRILSAFAGGITILFIQYRIQSKLLQISLVNEQLKTTNLNYRQVAHDLKSPLMALNAVGSKLAAVDGGSVQILLQISDRIRRISNDLLVKAGAPEIEDKDVLTLREIKSAISNLITERGRRDASERIRMIVSSEFDEDLKTQMRQSDLERIVTNIVDNAFEAEATALDIELKCEKQKVAILFKDNGKGILKSNLPKLGSVGGTFDKKGGHGLGLSFCKTKLKSYGGELKIENGESKGAVVSIVFNIE